MRARRSGPAIALVAVAALVCGPLTSAHADPAPNTASPATAVAESSAPDMYVSDTSTEPVTRIVLSGLEDPTLVLDTANDAIAAGNAGSSSANASSANDAEITVSDAHAVSADSAVLTLETPVEGVELDALLDHLRADPAIADAQPDQRVIAAYEPPSDTLYSQQWSLTGDQGMNVPAAWQYTTGDADVTVAVLDTGYTDHPDLPASWQSGYDFVSVDASYPDAGRDGDDWDSDPRDEGDWCLETSKSSSWHGTRVSGVVAAQHNGIGTAGIAPSVTLQSVRVLGQCGGWDSDIAAGIIWASGGTVPGVPANPNPADVINLSLGGSGSCATVTQLAVNTALANGAVVVAAAGNTTGTGAPISTPANCTGVISVAASTETGARAAFSHYGTEAAPMTITAPGTLVVTPKNSGSTTAGTATYDANKGAGANGTSFSSPAVAAAAALLLSSEPDLTPVQIKERLTATARAFPSACTNCTSTRMGAGILDIGAAVAAGAPQTPGTEAPTDPPVTEEPQSTSTASPTPSAEPTATPAPTVVPTPTPAPTVAPKPQKFSAAKPIVKGSTKVGRTLTAMIGSWKPGATTYTYQWYRNGKAITKATAKKYTLKAKDRGARLTVKVKGARKGYTSAIVFSARTTKISR